MAGFNRVILMGNLTANPELRYTPQGTAVADLRLAVNTTRGRGDSRKEDVLYIDVTVWDRQAETCSEYLSKGRPVLVEGRLNMDQWEDRETGQKRSKIRVVAQTVQFLGGGEGGRGGGEGGRGGKSRPQKPPRREQNIDEDFEGGDEIPF